ncbi:glutathione S-transferase family protein [Marinobacter zhejiangensis]|uniref:Glutathione S-transferase n=1 Tax=Marinobacter zhejiangensis TaxID=488535 RepID=A0A1I4L2L4_9GAMM|nr:glutathione S-transferase [Marinobacter zhejiangensis]SFL85235.1 glutathione S-transferase [Marinobacter zhejiangensis]
MAIKLYQFAISHYCEKIRWALDFKGLNYETISLLPGSHIKQIKSLTGKTSVPVLVHDDRVIQNSADIIDYLDKTFADRPLTPLDPQTRQLAREWERRLDTVAGPAIRCYCYHYLLQRPKQVVPMLAAQTPFYNRYLLRLGFSRIEEIMRNWMKINERTAQKAQQSMEDILAELAAAYQRSEFLVGNTFTRADLTAAALFAPLFQPEAYPVPWPSENRLPKPMQQWLESNQGQLAPLADLYTRYRQG